jgi:hypothetical protein
MMRRRRPLLRAAAVGGTAYAVGRHSGRQREEAASAEAEQNQRLADLEQQQAPPSQYQQPPPQYQQPPPPPAPAQPSMIDQINQLNELHQQGALSDEEFAAAKAKLLG